jgi:hypothetical protein
LQAALAAEILVELSCGKTLSSGNRQVVASTSHNIEITLPSTPPFPNRFPAWSVLPPLKNQKTACAKSGAALPIATGRRRLTLSRRTKRNRQETYPSL